MIHDGLWALKLKLPTQVYYNVQDSLTHLYYSLTIALFLHHA